MKASEHNQVTSNTIIAHNLTYRFLSFEVRLSWSQPIVIWETPKKKTIRVLRGAEENETQLYFV